MHTCTSKVHLPAELVLKKIFEAFFCSAYSLQNHHLHGNRIHFCTGNILFKHTHYLLYTPSTSVRWHGWGETLFVADEGVRFSIGIKWVDRADCKWCVDSSRWALSLFLWFSCWWSCADEKVETEAYPGKRAAGCPRSSSGDDFFLFRYLIQSVFCQWG